MHSQAWIDIIQVASAIAAAVEVVLEVVHVEVEVHPEEELVVDEAELAPRVVRKSSS